LAAEGQRGSQGDSDEEGRWNVRVQLVLNSSFKFNFFDRFQYVALQLTALANAESLQAVKQALQNLPAGLDQTYTQALLSIDQIQKAQAIRALKWLAFSKRPLTLRELAEASIIDPRGSPPFDKEKRLFSSTSVLKFLPSLVIVHYEGYSDDSDGSASWESSITDDGDPNSKVDSEDDSGAEASIVTLAHFSIKEFLVSDRIKVDPIAPFSFNEDDAHTRRCRGIALFPISDCG
jgi:ankyrin repeat domain-containing protein 50